MPDAVSAAPDCWEFFGSHSMIATLETLAQIRRVLLVERDPRAVVAAQLLVSLDAELAALSLRTAGLADKAIRKRIATTQRRPATSHQHHLADLIKSEPMPLGSVAVARLDELNKAVNPESSSSKSYWLTQEEGSKETGNQMIGRVLFGRFVGPSHENRPLAEYRGAAGAPGSEFIFGGPGSGYGTISHEIEGRHFLRDGAEAAWNYYRTQIQEISTRYAAEVAALLEVP